MLYGFTWLYMVLYEFVNFTLFLYGFWACGNCFSAWNGSLRNGSITDITLIAIVCSAWCATSASAECLTIIWFPMFYCEQHHSQEYLVHRIAKFDTTQTTGLHKARVKKFFPCNSLGPTRLMARERETLIDVASDHGTNRSWIFIPPTLACVFNDSFKELARRQDSNAQCQLAS